MLNSSFTDKDRNGKDIKAKVHRDMRSKIRDEQGVKSPRKVVSRINLHLSDLSLHRYFSHREILNL